MQLSEDSKLYLGREDKMAHITEDKWYALFVATGEEDKVKQGIYLRIKDEIRAIVPKRKIRERKAGKWEDKIRTLFPGYVLLNGKIDAEKYLLIRNIPGVIKILKDNDGFQEISKQEIDIISRLTYNDEIIGRSSVYLQGGRIMVADGPLLGLEGYIQAIDRRKGRVKVLLNLMGEPRSVELSVRMIQTA